MWRLAGDNWQVTGYMVLVFWLSTLVLVFWLIPLSSSFPSSQYWHPVASSHPRLIPGTEIQQISMNKQPRTAIIQLWFYWNLFDFIAEFIAAVVLSITGSLSQFEEQFLSRAYLVFRSELGRCLISESTGEKVQNVFSWNQLLKVGRWRMREPPGAKQSVTRLPALIGEPESWSASQVLSLLPESSQGLRSRFWLLASLLASGLISGFF